MASVTNKAQNAASPSNKELTQKSITFDETAPDTFSTSVGPFSTPYAIDNKAVNQASVTNKSIE